MRICFLNYTRPNLGAILERVRREASQGHDVEFVFGFDYDESESPSAPPTIEGVRWSRLIPDWVPSSPIPADRDPTFSKTLRDVIDGARFPDAVRTAVANAFSARYDWARLDEAVTKASAALPHLLRELRPDLVILPEQTDYLRGAPAARLARKFGIPFEVSLPRYYNAMASYPARADGAHCEWTPTGATAPRPGPAPLRLVLALQGLTWERVILDDLIEVLKDFPGLTLVVRPHPRLPFAEVEKLVDGLPRVEIDNGERLNFDTAAPFALIAQTSTLLDEAKRRGVNTVSVQYSGFPHELFTPSFPDGRHRVAESKMALREIISSWSPPYAGAAS